MNFRIYCKIILITFFSCTITLTHLSAQEKDKLEENLQKSRDVIKELHKALSKELIAGIKAGGIEKAINYCHQSAKKITDSFKTDKQSIRRISLKYRNSENKPAPYEAEKLKQLAQDHKKGNFQTEYYEIIEKDNVKYFRYFSPILIQPPCLSCHGKKEKLSPNILKALEKKYPDDKATGYKSGDLRGSFSVIIKQQNNL